MNPLIYKESFLQENQSFSELEITGDLKPIGKLQELDLTENEIWLLQCPKGMDVTQLENQKLKIPGRTNINNSEAISMEFNEGIAEHAFAYYSRKGSYALRLLPVRGSIVIRDRLKAAETITMEIAEERCSPNKRVPVPSCLRVRHPLLGAPYEDKLQLEKTIKKRLQKADEISARILKESIVTPRKIITENLTETSPIDLSSSSDDVVIESISKEKVRKKRKHIESTVENKSTFDQSSAKKKKLNKSKNGLGSEDLQWLQNI